jgi:hypothetical protein
LLAKEPISSMALGFQSGLGYSVGNNLCSAMVGSKRAIVFNPNYAKVHNVLWLASQEFGNYNTIAEMKLNDATSQNNPEKGKEESAYQAGKIAGEILAGGALSAVGGFGGVFLGVGTEDLAVVTALTLAGSNLGSAIGVYWVGTAGGESGSFLAALGGSVLGCAVGCSSYWVWVDKRCCGSEFDEEFPFVTALAFLTHSIGGTIAFNLEKKLSSNPESDAAIQIEDGGIRLAYPALKLKHTQLPNHRPEVTYTLDLVNANF